MHWPGGRWSNHMASEIQTTSQTSPTGTANVVLQILDRIEKTSAKGAATILFIVGIALFAFVYAVKFISFPLSKEMTSSEFVFSVVVAVLLVLAGTVTRMILYSMSLAETNQVRKDIIETENKVLERRERIVDDSSDQRSKNLANVA
jgi:hypothetical protein